jgi:hypothetical protein
VNGYQPVSRIGEIAMNAFVVSHRCIVLDDFHCHTLALFGAAIQDAHQWETLEANINLSDMIGDYTNPAEDFRVEHRPHFHEWASVQPGAYVACALFCACRRCMYNH